MNEQDTREKEAVRSTRRYNWSIIIILFIIVLVFWNKIDPFIRPWIEPLISPWIEKIPLFS